MRSAPASPCTPKDACSIITSRAAAALDVCRSSSTSDLADLNPSIGSKSGGPAAGAAAMLAGSYVAGSTPVGGGTVGFALLVLFFDLPAALGRDFSFAIQSAGMTSAGIFILARRQPIESQMLIWAMLGAAIGTP